MSLFLPFHPSPPLSLVKSAKKKHANAPWWAIWLDKSIKKAIKWCYCSLTEWAGYTINMFTQKFWFRLCLFRSGFKCKPPDSPSGPPPPTNFFYRHRADIHFSVHRNSSRLSTESTSSLAHSPTSTPFHQSSAYLAIRLKYLWWRHLLDSLSGGLEMEIEKLKGSERSVCARITAHFITGRDGQIWHKIKNTICRVFLALETAQLPHLADAR